MTNLKTVTEIRNTFFADIKAIYNGEDKLIATAAKTKEKDDDFRLGDWRICICGSVAHGKIAYAKDWEDLNNKSVEISKLP